MGTILDAWELIPKKKRREFKREACEKFNIKQTSLMNNWIYNESPVLERREEFIDLMKKYAE